MRILLAAFFVVRAFAATGDAGVPARPNAIDYPAQAEQAGTAVGAEALDAEQVRNAFSTDLRNYLVVEVALYPSPGQQIDLSTMDFAVKVPGRPLIRPASARPIAAINQKRSISRKDDILLYPSIGVGMGSGGYGTGTAVGVGVGMGGGNPGPASTSQDRRTMELELEEKGLPEGVTTKAIAGYLYFPVGPEKKRPDSYELTYQAQSGTVSLSLQQPKRTR